MGQMGGSEPFALMPAWTKLTRSVSEVWLGVRDDFRNWWTSTFDDARETRPASRSRERSERLAKVGWVLGTEFATG